MPRKSKKTQSKSPIAYTVIATPDTVVPGATLIYAPDFTPSRMEKIGFVKERRYIVTSNSALITSPASEVKLTSLLEPAKKVHGGRTIPAHYSGFYLVLDNLKPISLPEELTADLDPEKRNYLEKMVSILKVWYPDLLVEAIPVLGHRLVANGIAQFIRFKQERHLWLMPEYHKAAAHPYRPVDNNGSGSFVPSYDFHFTDEGIALTAEIMRRQFIYTPDYCI